TRLRQTRLIGAILLVLSVFVAVFFAWPVSGDASFRLAYPGDAFALPNLVVPAAPYAWVVAALLAFFGVRQFLPGATRWTGLLFGLGLLLLVTAFLTWAT
ncbi:MAG: hypothetical protein KDJ51_06720, partial [Nitratireductor sp.]|nr:hypothetical protein [Nitratireductor sp.]